MVVINDKIVKKNRAIIREIRRKGGRFLKTKRDDRFAFSRTKAGALRRGRKAIPLRAVGSVRGLREGQRIFAILK